MPIRSGAMQRPSDWRCGNTLRQRYDEVGLPCSSTMGSPSPTSTYSISLPRTRRRCLWYGNAAEIMLASRIFLLTGRRLRQHEIPEVGVLRGGAIRPEHENRAALLGAMWAVHIAGLEVKRRAGLVALAFVDEFAIHHVERLRKLLVIVRRDDGPGLHW